MKNLRERKILAVARQGKIAVAIKRHVIDCVKAFEEASDLPSIRRLIKTEKGVKELTARVCEDWATGLRLQGLMFEDAVIRDFIFKVVVGEYSDFNEDRVFAEDATYSYDLTDLVNFYWSVVGKVLCYC